VFGGVTELASQQDDPYYIPGRGLFYDGIGKLSTIRGLTLSHTFGLGFWIRAHSDGTLFSSSKIYDNGVEKSIHFGIIGNDLEFENKNHYFYWASNGSVVPYNVWVCVSLAAIWEQVSLHTVLELTVNDATVGTYSGYDHIIIDYPDTSYTHYLGALERSEAIVNYYEGFISAVLATNTPYEIPSLTRVVYDCKGTCFICNPDYKDSTCYGFCNWNQFWDSQQEQCKACPTWCREGCNNAGTCT
jgi:hypothetical protein